MLLNIPKLSTLIHQELDNLSLGYTPKLLYQPMDYILSLGGKRIRPLLTLIAYSLYKDDPKSIILPALSVEVFHNFTLMHDDIMDNAPLRRGKSTVHSKWNINTAILSGDAMMIKTYELLSSIDTDKYKDTIAIFNECATKVCEGQQLDMEFESRDDVTMTEYLQMIRLKTAVLIGYSLRLGALLAGASLEDCKALEAFGTGIGVGFQLKDDLLDVYGNQKSVGKQLAGDIISNKKTYLLIKSKELANNRQLQKIDKWMSKNKYDDNKKVKKIKAIYDELGIKQLAEIEVNKQFNVAFAFLNKLSASKLKIATLKRFAINLINREK